MAPSDLEWLPVLLYKFLFVGLFFVLLFLYCSFAYCILVKDELEIAIGFGVAFFFFFFWFSVTHTIAYFFSYILRNHLFYSEIEEE